MLTALRLGNFKAFAETQRVPIRPLTLIFGANSSGKSSLIHGLLLAHEAKRTGKLDVFRTELGGDSVDLGGFRQYVHRREAGRRVEWGALCSAAKIAPMLDKMRSRSWGGLGESRDWQRALGGLDSLGISLSIGIHLDDKGQPIREALPTVMSYEVEADGASLLRMSQRPSGSLQLDRLAHEHPVIREVLKAIVQNMTTAETLTSADFEAVDEIVTELVPKITAQVEKFLPNGLSRSEKSSDESRQTMMFPISRGRRKEELAVAVRLILPRILDELIRGLNEAVMSELDRLGYLGPLRSYPPRHLAFAQYHDPNWFAGGGYAWDVVRRDEKVRKPVNAWLSSPDRLQTPYELVVRELVGLDQLEAPLLQGIEEIASEGLDIEPDYDNEPTPTGMYPVIKDPDAEVMRLQELIQSADIDKLPELILIDRRTNTVVSHRDVGIGISQVLPVLVAAYASNGQILAMEQPEIHLHPALQAELGDVFIQSALGGQRNTFLLETHSEHLMLRILRRIRETTEGELDPGLTPIRPEQVAVLYVSPDKDGAKVVEIPIRPDGEFAERWPQGFFAERAKELF